MRLETPAWLDWAVERAESHQFVGWAGFFIGLGGGAWTVFTRSELWGGIVVALALFVGFILGIGIKRRRRPVRCIECVDEFTLTGARGRQASIKSASRFVFKRPTDGFILGMKHATGAIASERFFYRFMGRYCRDQNAQQREFAAGQARDGFRMIEGNHIYITLPTPADINDHYEVIRTYELSDSFEADSEEVGKFIFYPCKSLKLKVIFQDCVPENMLGYVSRDHLPVPGTTTPLDLRPNGNHGQMVEWDVKNAEPGQRYTVQWVWRKQED